jgi:hypothetical protein
MLNQEEIREAQEASFNKNKNYQLLLQTIIFSLVIYILFSKVCLTFIQNKISNKLSNKLNNKLDCNLVACIIFAIIYVIIMKNFII